MRHESVMGTITVAIVLCVVCSVLVSGAAVMLRPQQLVNQQLDRSKNILIAAGLYDVRDPPTESVESIYHSKVVPVLIDLESGQPVADSAVESATYDPREAAGKEASSVPVEPPTALHGIRRREKYAFVYLVKGEQGLEQIVLPIYGKGLWSTLYGFLALASDTETVEGITFYEHGETPGLGGEIDNPRWQALWTDKQALDDSGAVQIEVIKGRVNDDTPGAGHKIDGLSGATITTRGVSDLVRYWLGAEGFGAFLEQQRTDSLANSLVINSGSALGSTSAGESDG